MPRILVVDDDEVACEELCELLTEEGYEVVGKHRGEAALAAAQDEAFDVCISDIRMPGMSGLELLAQLREVRPETLVVLITAFGDMESAIAALRAGAKDYLLKPLKIDDLVNRLRQWGAVSRGPRSAFWRQRLAQEMSFGFRLRGHSTLMRETRRRLLEVAARPVHLLLVGEPGTGRKQAARSVHSAAASRFTTLDCDELGGRHHVGFQEQLRRASGGTYFLARVQTLSPELQTELFEALQGLAATDVRVVAAVEPDFDAAVIAGHFRADLRALLAGECIVLPPLRERREDVLVLIQHLIDQIGIDNVVFGVSPPAMEHLLGYHWPGNVDELATLLAAGLATAEGFVITLDELPEGVQMAPPLTLADLRPQTIGPYRIDARLGAGGMGEVYRGYDEQLRRIVAIKRLPADTDDPVQRSQLRQEARTIAQLRHPSIVQIYHLFEEEEQDYIVMEHVEGKTLAQRLATGPPDLSVSLALAIDVAAGLDAAHEIGVIHRDRKTANVMLPPKGRAKILDFGLATPFDGDPASQLIADGQIAGTHHALSPEHAMGEKIDPRSDLFSLGTLLYETVTGERPFTGETPMQILMEICNEPHTSVLELDARIPTALAELIDRLLEKEPDDRPQSAEEVQFKLEEIRGAWLLTSPPTGEPALGSPAATAEEVATAKVSEAAAVKTAKIRVQESPQQRLLGSLSRYLKK
jgi:DNA-binding NtrC family response regulator